MRRMHNGLVAALLALVILTGCTANAPAKTADGKVILKVGTLPVPHSDILEGLLPLTGPNGLAVEIVDFDDPRKADLALAAKEVDAVYAQSAPELEGIAQAEKLALVSLGPIHLEPFLLVSTKVMDLTDLGDGSRILIPRDPAGTGRALKLLAEQELITLRPGVTQPTLADIAGNPKQLVLEQVDALALPRQIADFDAAILTAVQMIEAKLLVQTWIKSLASESAVDNRHAAVLAVRKGDERRTEIQKLMQLLTSEQARQLIQAKYQGKVIPAAK